jgi:hypothetical protein
LIVIVIYVYTLFYCFIIKIIIIFIDVGEVQVFHDDSIIIVVESFSRRQEHHGVMHGVDYAGRSIRSISFANRQHFPRPVLLDLLMFGADGLPYTLIASFWTFELHLLVLVLVMVSVE